MREPYTIAFNCTCGKAYQGAVAGGTYALNHVDQNGRFYKCPFCGHVWDLRPDWPRPSNIAKYIIDGKPL